MVEVSKEVQDKANTELGDQSVPFNQRFIPVHVFDEAHDKF
jgi:hypothetical protein